MTVHTVCACPEGVQIRGFIGMRVTGFEVSESQICDLEFTVVWRSSVSVEHKNIDWLDILMPTEEIPISELHVQATQSIPTRSEAGTQICYCQLGRVYTEDRAGNARTDQRT